MSDTNPNWQGEVLLNELRLFCNSLLLFNVRLRAVLYYFAQGYALISGTMLMTRDGGKQWSPVSFNVADFTPQHMSFVNADKGWVVGMIIPKAPSQSAEQSQYGKLIVLHTLDGGKHWQQQLTKNYPEGRSIGSVDIDFVNATTGWFLTSNMLTWAGDLYYTSNAGLDWQKIN